ncbi:hypothetical protein OG455_41680 [Kitasatospora sp. NBC_01287]|uniref:hypothetical protein n=1 Tax=Kitasatospora sp. NBC_01287 TaxID=2903573 RepID=UPI0022545AE3|nr:hypothetical protein [Kitasatospora sp. NBC_01287]MCX4751753.1 hypothetical protein [Kitasatospora sp. NBC_01287]MCX4751955.1 hypothetical protein [Kitasatospora sp. NBC_01287]
MTDPAFVHQVLDVFARAECHTELLWHVRDESITFHANVSDVFAWGSADAEEITPERLPVLEQALTDLQEINSPEYLPELYAARIRGMRPQGAAYPDDAPTQALLDACGPERTLGLGNPKRPPVPKEVAQ